MEHLGLSGVERWVCKSRGSRCRAAVDPRRLTTTQLVSCYDAGLDSGRLLNSKMKPLL